MHSVGPWPRQGRKMTNRGFRLSDLIPEPLTFTDDATGGDGTVYDVLTLDLLSEQGVSRMLLLQTRMMQGFAEEHPQEAMQAINELISILIPGMAQERIAAIPLTLKTHFFDWWQQQHPKTPGRAMAPKKPPTRVPRGTPLRDSSPPTP